MGKYNMNLKQNRERKALRDQGPPAFAGPSLVSCGLSPFVHLDRQQNEFKLYDEASAYCKPCSAHNCSETVPIVGTNWCKGCRTTHSRNKDHRQSCKKTECNTVIGVKGQFKAYKQWCKGCRITYAIGLPPSPNTHRKSQSVS